MKLKQPSRRVGFVGASNSLSSKLFGEDPSTLHPLKRWRIIDRHLPGGNRDCLAGAGQKERGMQ